MQKFKKLKKYSGSPNASWIILSPLIQIPSFLLVVVSVRRMCAQSWPGLDTGGALWFTDLTQCTINLGSLETHHMGPIGAVLPVAITLAYLLNLELSFKTGRVGANVSGSIGDTIGKLLKFGMEWLAVPVLIITLQLPQGTLIYWLTSSYCSIGQNCVLGNASIRQKLKLPQFGGDSSVDIMSKFSPQVMDLFLKAAEFRVKGKLQDALLVLNKITDQDSENPRAHYAKGQIHNELKQWSDAIESYQSAFETEVDQKMKAKSLLGIGIARFMKV
eukprot:g2375.t1